MKRTLFQLFNLLMACVVLLSSTGFGLVEHRCQMRGKKTTLVVAFSDVSAQKGCASGKHNDPAPTETVVKKTDCCQDDERYENVDIASSLSQYVAKAVKTVADTILLGVSVLVAWIVEHIIDRHSSTIAFPSPPSLSGRDILILVRSLLI